MPHTTGTSCVTGITHPTITKAKKFAFQCESKYRR